MCDRWHKETVSPHWRVLPPAEREPAPVFGERRRPEEPAKSTEKSNSDPVGTENAAQSSVVPVDKATETVEEEEDEL